MIVAFFKRNPASSIIAIPLVAIALWFNGFLHPMLFLNKNTMPLYDWVFRATVAYPLLQTILAVFLLVAEAFFLNHICEKYNIVAKKTNFPAFIYVLLMSSTQLFIRMHPLIFANLFLLLSIERLLSSYHKEEAFAHVFDAGLYIGIASLFYFPALVTFPMVWVALIVIRTFVWREWIISFLGLLLPYIFILTYYYWFDKVEFFLLDKIFYPSSEAKYSLEAEPWTFLFLCFSLLGLMVLSFLKLTQGLPVNTILSRNVLVVFIWMVALSLLAFFMAPVLNILYFSFVAIPFSIYLSHFLLSIKKGWIAELLFSAWFMAMLLNLFVRR